MAGWQRRMKSAWGADDLRLSMEVFIAIARASFKYSKEGNKDRGRNVVGRLD